MLIFAVVVARRGGAARTADPARATRDRRSLPASRTRRARPRACSACRPNLVLALLAAAAFMCCVPMAMPQGHLVALCTDLGIAPSHGAAMLSVLLGCAFFSRQFWGWVSDRIGGLRTVLAGSIMPDRRDGRLPADPQRGRPVRRGDILRPGLQRHGPGLRAGGPRTVSRRPRRRGASRRCCCSAARGWRLVAGWRASSTTGSGSTARRSRPAWCSTWPTSVVIGALVLRRATHVAAARRLA